MIHAVAAVAALGIVLVYSGITSPPDKRPSVMLARVNGLAAQSGIRGFTGGMLISVSAVAAVVTFTTVAGITGSFVIGLALAAIAGVAPFSIASARRTRRMSRFRDAWPDAIATLIANVRAGVSLPESCLVLFERAPEELRAGFGAFAATYRASGSFVTGLDRLRDELADPIADRVVAALALAHEVGGSDLVRVLRTLGDFVREDIRVRKEIEARWSWTVTAARVAAAAPWVVLVMMATRPEAAAAYNSATGAMVVIAGAVATLVGYRLMLRAARLPEDRRIE